MQIVLNLSKVLEGIAIIISRLCGKVDLDSEKFSKIISKGVTAFSICFFCSAVGNSVH